MFNGGAPETFKRQVRSSFDRTTAGYGKGDFHERFARRLVARAPIVHGARILDIATGTAPAAVAAAQRTGPSGSVVGVDYSLGMLKLGRPVPHGSDRYRVALVCGDAEQLPFRDASFDGVLCSSAIVWFPDIPRALAEWHRLLRDGGWLAFSCFGGPGRETVNGLLIRLLAAYGKGFPELNTPLNSPTKCRSMLERADFVNVRVSIGQQQRYTSAPDAAFELAWASTSRFDLALAGRDKADLRARYIAAFEQHTGTRRDWNVDYEQYVIGRKR